MIERYEAIIIGAGQAGPSLAARLAKEGMRVAIIERKLFGGTCVNTGCIPTKSLVASAYVAHLVQRAAAYGVFVDGTTSVDMQKVKARKDTIVNKSNHGVENWLKNLDNCTVYEGHARFIDANTVSVDDTLLQSDKIFIDVGARAFTPPLAGLDQVEYFDNSSIMHVDFLPEHLIIIGGSYIGLEFAQMYRRFGAKVSVVEKASRLIPREDEDISDAVKQILENENIDIHLNAECIKVMKQDQQIQVQLNCESGDREISGSHMLVAVGRQPNTDDLALDKAGVETDERGFIKVDEQLRTNVPGIWALGECNGQGAFTHTAYNDYEIVAANLLDNHPRRLSDRILTYGLFIDPPLARVGLTEAQARQSGRNLLIGTRPMTRVSRAVEKSETQGFMKVLVDADSKEILGAAILGVGGDEAIHCILDVMYAKAAYTVISEAVHIHPTVAELIPTMLGEL